MKQLKSGLWLSTRVYPGTREQEIIDAIDSICGVKIEPECISMGDKMGLDGKFICIISFEDQALCKILTWMLSETPVHGKILSLTPPKRAQND